MSPSISDLDERELVSRIEQRAGAPPPGVTIGIGDDAAVISPARNQDDVVTTDSLIEGVHFRRDWSPASAIGYKALAVNLSDLAAMGARPRAALLSLALPADLPLADFDALIEGFLELAVSSGTTLVGGNLARSPGPLVVDVTAIGSVGRRRVLQRNAARPGDELYVTGRLGAAAAGLAMFQAGRARADIARDAPACLDRYERPQPRVRIGGIVGRSAGASGAIDLSDGLADAAWRLAEGSRCGLVIDAGAVPIEPEAAVCARAAAVSPLAFCLAGGEDYELAFVVPARRRSRLRAAARRCSDVPVTRIGRFVADTGVWLEENGARSPLPRTGFSHF